MSSEYKSGPRCKYIFGKKWYPFLIDQEGRSKELSLLSSESYSSDSIYVRGTFKGYYSFSVFDNVLDLKKYIESFHLAYRCFDEIVVSELQKPRFDIDIENIENMDDTLQLTLDYLIDAIIALIPGISLEHSIRVYTSHGTSKRSLHLIVDGYFHESHESTKGFYQSIIEYIPGNLVKFIDSGIYGKNKQLRIAGCCKWNDVRTKTLQESYKYRNSILTVKWGELDNEVVRFMSSLITVITNCTQLPPFAVAKKVIIETKVADAVANAALELTRSILAEKYTFDLNKISGSLILLKRKSPSLCPTCGVIHEKEHPYLSVTGVNVYFNCRRNRFGRSFYVGRIDETNTIVTEKTVEKEIEKIDPNSKVIDLGDKGSFVIRKKKGEVTEDIPKKKGEVTEDTPKKDEEVTEDTPKIAYTSMKSGDIMNRLNNLNKSDRPKKPRRHKEEQSNLSSVIDITSFF